MNYTQPFTICTKIRRILGTPQDCPASTSTEIFGASAVPWCFWMLGDSLSRQCKKPGNLRVFFGDEKLPSYIYTLGAWGSPGTPAPRGFIYMKLVWGGVGMVTFLALAHMVGATQVMGWGGVGVGWGW